MFPMSLLLAPLRVPLLGLFLYVCMYVCMYVYFSALRRKEKWVMVHAFVDSCIYDCRTVSKLSVDDH
jgi:hypothetical protein